MFKPTHPACKPSITHLRNIIRVRCTKEKEGALSNWKAWEGLERQERVTRYRSTYCQCILYSVQSAHRMAKRRVRIMELLELLLQTLAPSGRLPDTHGACLSGSLEHAPAGHDVSMGPDVPSLLGPLFPHRQVWSFSLVGITLDSLILCLRKACFLPEYQGTKYKAFYTSSGRPFLFSSWDQNLRTTISHVCDCYPLLPFL